MSSFESSFEITVSLNIFNIKKEKITIFLSPALFCFVMMTRDSRPLSGDDIARPGVHLQWPPRDHPDHQQLESEPGPGAGCRAHRCVVLRVSPGNHPDHLWLVTSHFKPAFPCDLSVSYSYVYVCLFGSFFCKTEFCIQPVLNMHL